MTLRSAAWIASAAVLAALSACTVGPDYKRPDVATPIVYKEVEGWKLSEPRDWADRGAWWSVYSDPLLDGLERQIEISNQNLRAAEAAFREASAVVRAARASYFPAVSLDASAQRAALGPRNGSSGSRAVSTGRTQNQYDLSTGASWIPDAWGRIRRTVESDEASAQASAADLASARLSAQATLATAYFQLRIDDEIKRLLDAAVDAYATSLEIARNRYAAGTAARSDVVSAEAQLETTRAQAIGVGVQRAQLEHSIAVLIGKPPAEFAIEPALLAIAIPAIPPGMPSTLLERRPDIAAAERRMAAANAQIGVAEAAFFPDLTLSASYGFSSSLLSSLVQASNRVWSIGPQLAVTLFDAGARTARVEGARATYDQTVAGYRQTVLTGFQQIEDALAALRILAQQAEVEERAVRAAREAEQLVLNQYKAGTVAYTSVLTAQTTALSSEQNALGTLQSRFAASVALIEALGGGWTTSELPTAEQSGRRSDSDPNAAKKLANDKPP
ncbi:MAG: efflux transporter outer membrane subunit [Proteobacteria bacterium]|nr:efflux transporter outer membrane subunit [Pseudomonadota bacterium]